MSERKNTSFTERASVHLPYLDGIRGIAILAVFLYHGLYTAYGYDQLPWKGGMRNFDAPASFLMLYPFTYGFAGVAIFFMVSGFCIHLSYSRSQKKGWGDFFSRRWFRIYPPYLLAILLFFFIWPFGSFDLEGKKRVTQLWTHVFAVHNFTKSTFYGINSSFWSIAVEFQLYLIYPILIGLTKSIGWKRSLAVTGGIELVIRSISTYYSSEPLPRAFTDSPMAYWWSWSLGAYLCECYLQGKRSRFFSIRFDIALLACILVPLFESTVAFAFPVFSLATAIAVERLLWGQWKGPSLEGERRSFGVRFWGHLSSLGVISYSFYLLHQPFMKQTRRFLKYQFPDVEIDPLVRYGICMALYPFIFWMSFAAYKYVELPSITLGKKMAPQWKNLGVRFSRWIRSKKGESAWRDGTR